MHAVVLTTILGQSNGYTEPVPGGWFAVGGALAITAFTVLALRRLSKWSIGDLEDALARSRVELDRARAELDDTLAASDRLRASWLNAQAEAGRLRGLVARLQAELAECREGDAGP